MRIRPRLSAVLGAAALVVAACGSDDGSNDAATHSDTDNASNDAGSDNTAADAPEGTDFNIVVYQGEDQLGGEEIEFASVLGHGTPVFLNFWAGNCPPCLAEMPWLNTVSQQYEGEVLLVGVDVGQFTGLGTTEDAERVMEELGITYPTAYATEDTPVREHVVGMPTSLFFDSEGKNVGKHSGILVESQIEDVFAQLASGDF